MTETQRHTPGTCNRKSTIPSLVQSLGQRFSIDVFFKLMLGKLIAFLSRIEDGMENIFPFVERIA
jgi:hypothetical protein